MTGSRQIKAGEIVCTDSGSCRGAASPWAAGGLHAVVTGAQQKSTPSAHAMDGLQPSKAASRAREQHLVPFSELVPMARLLRQPPLRTGPGDPS